MWFEVAPTRAFTYCTEPLQVPMASSIMMAGLTGHVGLPPMYSEMKKPSDFEKTCVILQPKPSPSRLAFVLLLCQPCAQFRLYWSFFLMFIIYGYVGVCGYFLYGGTSDVLTRLDSPAVCHDVVHEPHSPETSPPCRSVPYRECEHTHHVRHEWSSA